MNKHENRNSGDAAVQKALALFLALARGGQSKSLTILAKELGIAPSSAYRLIQPFISAGLLSKPKRQCYVPGLSLYDIAQGGSVHTGLTQIARPSLIRLAKQLKKTVHLGVWDEDMVTYLIKAGPDAPGAETSGIFTREGMQLEAYCSGIGKVLLAHMPEARRETYLAHGPFVALTVKTVTDPAIMRRDLKRVKDQGYGEDNEEISPGLFCKAVPVFAPDGHVLAAISASAHQDTALSGRALDALRNTATKITALLGQPTAP